jgi:D-beta-D-heptose 7-phosphate kinase / D-beta-D-heptose 1-phosphate adenosyltransferase
MQYQFDTSKVLVVGDAMLDQYWSGSTERTSPEAPVAIAKVSKKESIPGGACNTAVNIHSLGGQVKLLAAIGDDDEGKILINLLQKPGLTPLLQIVPGSQTIRKLRVLSHQQQLIRADFEQKKPVVNYINLRTFFEQNLPAVDTVVFSDYAKGTLSPDCIHDFIALAQQHKKPVFVKPGLPDLKNYRGAHLLSLNTRQLTAAVGDVKAITDLHHKTKHLLMELQLHAILVTQGSQGMTLFQVEQEPLHFPTTQKEIFDVTGASDTVVAVMALVVASGYSLATAARLANVAASLVVTKVGTASVSIKELNHALKVPAYLAESKTGIVTEEELLQEIEKARQRDEKIVMTNGCFDLLHAGHIAYLRRAKKMGDRLIVAINEDASIRRLKGPTRPIMNVTLRKELLAAVKAVDWVVSFAEDTPNNLILKIKPDLLVKGTDYAEKEIVGGELVTSYGGKIKAIKHTFSDVSTSKIIVTIHHIAENPL